MKNKKTIILVILFLLITGYLQDTLYSPLTPKAAAIAHFKINPKMIPKSQQVATSQNLLTETEIKEKHGRLELVRLTDDTILRGVVIEQGEGYIRVETSSGIRKISTDQVDTVEIIR
jgi:hypothetical protein